MNLSGIPQTYVCPTPAHRQHWVVLARLCNHSAFNGYRRTPSAYSTVRCPRCPRTWRTRAAYVAALPDAPTGRADA